MNVIHYAPANEHVLCWHRECCRMFGLVEEQILHAAEDADSDLDFTILHHLMHYIKAATRLDQLKRASRQIARVHRAILKRQEA